MKKERKSFAHTLSGAKQMNKKGYLFTIITVILFSALIFLAATYSDRIKKNEEVYIKAMLGDKIKYIESDIGIDFFDYWEMELVEIEPVGGSKVRVWLEEFYNVNGTGGPDYGSEIEGYEEVVENLYSKKMNADIIIKNLTSGFVIHPYNTTFTYDQDNGNIYIYPDPDRVNDTQDYDMRVDVTNRDKNDEDSNNNEEPANDPNGWVNVKVQVGDKDGQTIEDFGTTKLDPYQANDPWILAFDDGMRLRMYYGMYNGIPGVIRVIRNNPAPCFNQASPCDPEPLHLSFYKFLVEFQAYSNEAVYITNKDPSLIDVKVDELKKEKIIVLARET